MEISSLKKKIIYGRRNVEEFIKTNQVDLIESIWVKESFYKEAMNNLLKFIPNKNLILIKNQRDLDLACSNKNHQGIIIWLKNKLPTAKDFHTWKKNLKPSLGPLLILDRIQDPGNLGNILRTAECFGVGMVLISDKNSCEITETVERISCGASYLLDIYKIPNLSQAIELLKKKDYWILALTEKGNENWKSLPSAKDLVIILGNEGEGIKDILIKNSDFQLRIPIHGKISSLNVGVACGIALDRIINLNSQ